MIFWIIKHTDEEKFICFKGGSPYWTDKRHEACPYQSQGDAQSDIRRYGLAYVNAIKR